MRYHLDHPLHIGDRQIAVISRIKTGHHHLGRTLVIQGRKMPVYIIVKDKDHMVAFGASGERIAWEEIERACPEAAARAIDVF